MPVERAEVPLNPTNSQFRRLFEQVDTDHDGTVTYHELADFLRSHEGHGSMPDHVVQRIMALADDDGSRGLDYSEFDRMMKNPAMRHILGSMMQRYVKGLVPKRRRRRASTDTTDGAYEEEYSLWPPPICMVLISVVELMLFCVDQAAGHATTGKGPAAEVLIYDPHKRYEAWRYLSYMFVHIGVFHVVVNVLVQVLLGIPLEMVHRGWRVMLIYLAGVLAGSLGTSVSDPSVFLAGASGGVYALIAAHVASIIMNWKEMEFAVAQLFVFVVITVSDVGTAIYNRYQDLNDHIGYAAHLAGALAGLLVGINVLRNLEVTSLEKKLWWISFVAYFALTITLVLWNVLYPDYFPTQY